jgi:hypothetical protein
VKARQITKELEETKQHLFQNKETNDGLVKAVTKGTAKMESLRDDGLRWKAKYIAATEDVRVKTRQIAQELDETKRHLLDTKDTNEELVKGVRNGITKWERVREDRLRWKTKHLAGLEDVRVRGEQLAQAQQTIRDMRKAGRSDTKRDADLQAELRTKLDAALLHAKVVVSTLFFLFLFCVVVSSSFVLSLSSHFNS